MPLPNNKTPKPAMAWVLWFVLGIYLGVNVFTPCELHAASFVEAIYGFLRQLYHVVTLTDQISVLF